MGEGLAGFADALTSPRPGVERLCTDHVHTGGFLRGGLDLVRAAHLDESHGLTWVRRR
jgi:hypothetical protein